jgi:hypothetical protein
MHWKGSSCVVIMGNKNKCVATREGKQTSIFQALVRISSPGYPKPQHSLVYITFLLHKDNNLSTTKD